PAASPSAGASCAMPCAGKSHRAAAMRSPTPVFFIDASSAFPCDDRCSWGATTENYSQIWTIHNGPETISRKISQDQPPKNSALALRTSNDLEPKTPLLSALPEQSLHELGGLKFVEILGALAEAHEANWQFQVMTDTEHDTAFCGAVQLG